MAKRILIVDDERRVVKAVRAMLEHRGYEVEAAYDGRQALASIAAACPDLVLLDLVLPELDGTTVAQRLKDNPKTATLPIVFLTGLVRAAEARRRGSEPGGRLYLAKPFDAEELYSVIDRALGGAA